MNRRRFLSLFGLGVAGVALEEAIPLGRVWSFPKEIVIAPVGFSVQYIRVWDRAQARYISRFDQLFGFGNLHEADNAIRVRQESGRELIDLRDLTTAARLPS